MARMYSRKHGKSGSKKPPKKKKKWVVYDKEEIKKLITKLSQEGSNNSEIGMLLRDQYGIPTVRDYGMKVSMVAEKKEVPEDLYALLEKSVILHRHMDKNKKDSISKRSLELLESHIRRFVKYYTRTGKLPKDWKYTRKTAELIVK